jgi:enoyl-CoA hydratase/carnithine racemase
MQPKESTPANHANPQIRLTKISKTYWKATFDHPPVNLINPETIRELEAIVTQLETDKDVTVIVFDSADPDFFFGHYDLSLDLNTSKNMAPGPTGMHPWPDLLVRLSRVPAVTIASIRGRTEGAGSEFALSCDIRFASREKAIFGQLEVATGTVPGGNPMVRLSHLMGRGRTLELLEGSDDFSGDLADRYGYINRALPDAELDGFVDTFAHRVASYDKAAVTETKKFVDRYTLPPDTEFPPALEAWLKLVERPETVARVMALFKQGLQTRSDVELNLGAHLGKSNAQR